MVIVFRNLLDNDDFKSSGRVLILDPEKQPAELDCHWKKNPFFPPRHFTLYRKILVLKSLPGFPSIASYFDLFKGQIT